jgi:hypothetical protein
VTDPEVLLGWLIAAYLAVVCVVAAVATRTGFDIPAAARSTWGRIVPARSVGEPEWTLGPAAVLSLAYVAATVVVVVVVWLPVRDLGLPNLVQFASATAPADVRHLAIAAILGWSLLVVNAVVAKQLVETLLPEELKRSQRERDRMGAAIGVLERVLVVILTVSGGPVAIGFVVAAKTLARFKKLDKDKDFAERYLLGTLASVTIALASALAAQLIWYRTF